MGWMRKHTGVGLVVAASGFLGLSACTTDPVSSQDIEYEEIRIDAFSNFWLQQKIWAEDMNGDSLFYDDRYYGMLLVDKARDLTASLPAHTVDSTEFHGTRAFYTAKREPENFSCQLRSTGRFTTFFPDEIIPGQIPAGTVYTTLIDTGDGLQPYEYMNLLEGEEWRTMFCLYVPGKGFVILDNTWDVGEIIIRY
jgi:hypothetical protein